MWDIFTGFLVLAAFVAVGALVWATVYGMVRKNWGPASRLWKPTVAIWIIVVALATCESVFEEEPSATPVPRATATPDRLTDREKRETCMAVANILNEAREMGYTNEQISDSLRRSTGMSEIQLAYILETCVNIIRN